MLKGFGTMMVGIVFIIVMFFGISQLLFTTQEYFAPKYQALKHEVWSNTTERINGMTRQLVDLKFEYDTSEEDVVKKAILDRIRTEFAGFDSADIDNLDLRIFLENVMNGNLK